MLKKLMDKKRNNKGFSLVELIVVVLIIAIIAVALAPQVMKWVGTSRTNTDENNKANIKAAISAALADYTGKGYSLGTVDGSYTCNGGSAIGVTHELTDGTNVLSTFINEVMSGEFPKTQTKTTGYIITVDHLTGKVTITY